MKINTKLTLTFLIIALILLVAASAVSYFYSQGLLAPLSNLWNILLPVMLFLLAVVLVSCLFLVRAMRKSISTLTQAAAEISQGDLSSRVEIISNDEIVDSDQMSQSQ